MHIIRWAPALAAALLAACSPDPAPAPPAASRADLAPPAPPASPGAPAAEPAADDAANAALPPLLAEEVLARVARVGDPFQPSVAERPTPPRDDRPRKSGRYAIAQLKLVAIVHGGDAPRAMVVDPRGKGWVIRQGDLLGRPELAGGAADERPASWRVDRIRARDVVLVREGEGAASAGVTHVLALPPEPAPLDEDDEVAVYMPR